LCGLWWLPYWRAQRPSDSNLCGIRPPPHPKQPCTGDDDQVSPPLQSVGPAGTSTVDRTAWEIAPPVGKVTGDAAAEVQHPARITGASQLVLTERRRVRWYRPRAALSRFCTHAAWCKRPRKWHRFRPPSASDISAPRAAHPSRGVELAPLRGLTWWCHFLAVFGDILVAAHTQGRDGGAVVDRLRGCGPEAGRPGHST
jgi:hypothetical protein